MSSTLVALCIALGAGAWVWSQLTKRTGNADPKSIYIMAGASGVAAFIVLITLFKFILHI